LDQEDIAEENGQFEQVLSRLDALMKRSQGQDVPEPPAAVPVLTEVFVGGVLTPIAVVEQEAPPVLTEFVAPPLVEDEVVEEAPEESPTAEAVVEPDEVSVMLPPPLSVQEVDALLTELMPMFREMIARVAQEEFFYAQQNLMLRVVQEAEQMLRLRLLHEAKPKPK